MTAFREIPELLVRLADEPAADDSAYPIPKDIEVESNIAAQQMNTKEFLENVESIGMRTTYTCQSVTSGKLVMKSRCDFAVIRGIPLLLTSSRANSESGKRVVVSCSMEEKVTFSRQMAERMKNYNLDNAVKKYEDYARNLDKEVSIVRELILNGFATKRNIAEDEGQLE